MAKLRLMISITHHLTAAQPLQLEFMPAKGKTFEEYLASFTKAPGKASKATLTVDHEAAVKYLEATGSDGSREL